MKTYLIFIVSVIALTSCSPITDMPQPLRHSKSNSIRMPYNQKNDINRPSTLKVYNVQKPKYQVVKFGNESPLIHIEDDAVYLYSDKITPMQGFWAIAHIQESKFRRSDKYVKHKGEWYYRPAYTLMAKTQALKKVGDEYVKVRI